MWFKLRFESIYINAIQNWSQFTLNSNIKQTSISIPRKKTWIHFSARKKNWLHVRGPKKYLWPELYSANDFLLEGNYIIRCEHYNSFLSIWVCLKMVYRKNSHVLQGKSNLPSPSPACQQCQRSLPLLCEATSANGRWEASELSAAMEGTTKPTKKNIVSMETYGIS